MSCIIYSEKGNFIAHIREIPSKINDGFSYVLEETKKKYLSQGGAIRSARIYLRKKEETLPHVKRERIKKVKKITYQRIKKVKEKDHWIQVRMYD